MPDDRPARARPVRVAARAPDVASRRRASAASRLAVATWGVVVVLGISGPPVRGPAPLVLTPAAAQRTVTGPPAAMPTAAPTTDPPTDPTTEPLPPPVPAPAAEMQPATFTSDLPDGRARIAIMTAMAQIGLPYVWGGDGPTAGDAGFDCSGLSTFAYAAAGVTLPRTAHTQYYAGPHVPADAALQPGDLVFYGTPDRVHHVGLYLGDGLMVNAPTFGRPVQAAYVRWSGDDYLGATRPAASGGPRSGFLPVVPPAPTPPREPGTTEFVAPPAPPPAAVPDPGTAVRAPPGPTPPAAAVPPTVPSPEERVLAAPAESGTPTPGSPAALAAPSDTATTPPPAPPTTTRPTTTQPTTTPATRTLTTPASTPAQAQVPRTSPTAAPDPTTTPPKPVPPSTTVTVGGTVADVAVVGGGADGLPRAAGIWARPGRPVLRLSAAPAVGSTATITEPDGTAAGYTVRTRTRATTAEAARAVAAAPAGRLVIVAPAGAGSWTVVTAA